MCVLCHRLMRTKIWQKKRSILSAYDGRTVGSPRKVVCRALLRSGM